MLETAKCFKVADYLYHDVRCDNDVAKSLSRGIKDLMFSSRVTPAEMFYAFAVEIGSAGQSAGPGTEKLISDIMEVLHGA